MTITIPRNYLTQGPFPSSIKDVKLRYVSTKTLGMSSVGVDSATFQFAFNGLFDPDIAVGGQQPVGFDQLMAVYSQYRVTACKCTITASFINPALTTNYTCYLRLTARSQYPTAINTWPGAFAQPNTKFLTLVQQEGIVSVSQNMSVKQLVGPSTDTTDVLYSGNAGTNPSQLAVWEFSGYSPNATATPIQVEVMVRLTYTADFFAPQAVNIS